jgi:hypothetical protein
MDTELKQALDDMEARLAERIRQVGRRISPETRL